ncbi:glycerophosphodiester phosphodiesterase family protein [Brevundimonas sp.]|uniref:glycerophosphodiester phosphodiesterase family protein n=1 Tax=Brevundimonas sp. TaxID=1871086 RepID=UPI0024878970|nr:glycerophosphodiester phosphodiesterase family protein [Brevundimonas sp.]MDI1279820.1 glycerophosphodiester phosphodiesterase family protein [Brevundimonas sp.]
MFQIILSALAILAGPAALPTPAPLLQVIAHRGASGERPEHTRAAYDLAIDQGADVIEPDLVMSRDGVLIVRHENEIGETTDVAAHPEFADRQTRRTVDGQVVTGWFTEDFTLAELQTLRARERLPAVRPANTAYDGTGSILTFQQVIDIARAGTERTGRVIGVAPELKHPSHFAAAGLPMEDAFVAVLEANGLTGADAPILIQCFEVGPLKRLAARIDAPRLQLMSVADGPVDRPDLTYAAMATPAGLTTVATYAGWIGVEAAMIAPDLDRPQTALIADAHAAGLKVAAWTFRAEAQFLPPGAADLTAWLTAFRDFGLDAAFSDFPAAAVAVAR